MKDLYATIDGKRIELRKFDAQVAEGLTSGSNAGEILYELKQEYWSGADNNLPKGIQAIYVSGSKPQIPISPGSEIAVAGELAMFRTDNGQQKAYRNLLVISGSNDWFYGEEFKGFTDHHYSGSHPTGSIWGKKHPKWPET